MKLTELKQELDYNTQQNDTDKVTIKKPVEKSLLHKENTHETLRKMQNSSKNPGSPTQMQKTQLKNT